MPAPLRFFQPLIKEGRNTQPIAARVHFKRRDEEEVAL
ncbi:hypothetical protein HMPREF9413_3939 [Paenibacillus sp. HGF7]|nr:hypothetical protein HMPREF9413_3939 [Paenibacillus sp. HGF7]